MKTIHLIISGKVQGVFFRARAKDLAKKYKIAGWIKNTDDDKVEAMITGDDDDVKSFEAWCRKGPEKAKVENVEITNVPLQIFESFEILRRN